MTKRYRNTIVMDEGGPHDRLEEHPDGEWVSWEDYSELKNWLAFLYDKWENGESCWYDGIMDNGYMGVAVNLTAEEEIQIRELLKNNERTEDNLSLREGS